MSAINETWQVMCDAGIFETDLEGLKEWVAEGRVHPGDKVRKGNLRWIEAGRAPVLRGAFAGEMALAGNQSAAAIASQGVVEPQFAEPHGEGFANESFAPEPSANDETYDPAASDSFVQQQALYATSCYFHVGVQPKYICRSCATTFCAECPKFVSGRIALCKLCGELCSLYEEVKERGTRLRHRSAAFGFEDFGTALSYPFKNIYSLVGGAFIYGLLLLGGFKGKLLASAILFGCISIVINKVVAGRMDKNFMPDFSSFSWWDDFLMPIFLGLGVTIVTIGPAILLAIMLLMGVIHSAASSPLDRMKPQTAQQKTFTREDMQKLANGSDEQSEEELRKKMEEAQPGSQFSRVAEDSKDSNQSQMDTLRWLFNVPGFIIPLLLLALAWAVFYYPMALCIAGYTEDFWSVVNPLVGLDTIRRMGATYFKAFFMYLCVQAFGSLLGLMAYIVLAPFNLPFIGNLPARFVEGTITFYTSLVIACILGLALYKSADKLGIATD